MSRSDTEKWNAKHRAGDHDRVEPARVLSDYSHLLPRQGQALDLACGTGANALFLARRGLKTSAWDISAEAISILRTRAIDNNLILEGRVCDVTDTVIPAQSFDVIIVSYFLERSLFPALINALKVNGLLFYQTWTRERSSDRGPHNENFRLDANELLHLCHDLHIVLYREEGLAGDLEHGLRDMAMLIGQRR
jgi:SAM-dependent methyltransferase